jgi:substrate-binding family protein
MAARNDRGGINGRKVNLISLDNAFSPAKALEQTRRLVESDEVFAIAGSFGLAPSLAVQRYLNSKRVPNLFLTSGIEKFNDPMNFPWIVPFYPLYVAEGKVFGRYVLEQRPSAKGAVLRRSKFGFPRNSRFELQTVSVPDRGSTEDGAFLNHCGRVYSATVKRHTAERAGNGPAREAVSTNICSSYAPALFYLWWHRDLVRSGYRSQSAC